MPASPRPPRRRLAPRLESLEARGLLSLLLTDRPTLNVIPSRGVRPDRRGGFTIVQPAVIHVSGTAQPTINVQAEVGIFAEDDQGNILNGGLPLATTTPDALGHYATSLTLPSTMRKDVNHLFALEAASGVFPAVLDIQPATLSGLTGTIKLNGSAIQGLSGILSLSPGTISGLTGVLATFPAGITGLTGSISNPGASISLNNGTSGTISPTTSTLSGGSGTLGALAGNLSNGHGTEDARGGTLSEGGGTVLGSTGTLSQTGTAVISGTTAVQATAVEEFAASDPVTIFIHQGRGRPPLLGLTQAGVPHRGRGPIHINASGHRNPARR